MWSGGKSVCVGVLLTTPRTASHYILMTVVDDESALDVPVVNIDDEGGYKYVLCRVTNGSEEMLVVWAEESCDFHMYIVRRMRRRLNGLDVRCLGGGHISINPDEEQIRLSRKSGDFGREPDRAHTAEILESQTGFAVDWS
jgi:hypothetical protein